MRVLLTSCPSYGHVNPMLPLAREARHAGHEVVIATGAELVPEIERRGFDTWLVGPSRAESDATFRAANPNLVRPVGGRRTVLSSHIHPNSRRSSS